MSNKKEETALAKKEEQALAQTKQSLEETAGLSGFSDTDLPIPMVKLVTNKSEETLLQDGTPAPINQFHNTGSKETVNPLIFRIIAVAKGEAWSDKANNGQGAMIKKIIFYGRDEKTGEMFFMPISSTYAYWEFRNRVLPIISKAVKAGNNIVDVVLQGDKDSKDNEKYGKITYPVFKLVHVKPLEAEEREHLISIQAEFSAKARESMDDAEEATETPGKAKGDANLNVDNVELPA